MILQNEDLTVSFDTMNFKNQIYVSFYPGL